MSTLTIEPPRSYLGSGSPRLRDDPDSFSEDGAMDGRVFFATSAVMPAPRRDFEYPLYEALAKSIEDLGLGTRLPHRDLASLEEKEREQRVERIIGLADVVLVDIAHPLLPDAQLMIKKAIRNRSLFLPFMRKGAQTYAELVKIVETRFATVLIESDQSGVKRITEALRKEYFS